MTTMTAAAPRRTGGFAWLREWFANGVANCRKETQIRRTIAELRSLSDRELEDIGINRYDIDTAVRGNVVS